MLGGTAKKNRKRGEAMGTFRDTKEEIVGKREMRSLPQVLEGSSLYTSIAKALYSTASHIAAYQGSQKSNDIIKK